jgi:leucyl-tRNA synthetase
MTVLANEQVIDGRGWRSGAIVERRKLSQWFFKITRFAENCCERLDTLDRWPEKVRLMQKNWIGKSEGLRFQFTLSTWRKAGCLSPPGPTRLFGASFVALSPDHPWPRNWRRRPSWKPLSPNAARPARRKPKSRKAEKLGYDTGLTATHPFDPNGSCR